MMTDPVLEGAAHVVQLALTPVFLLSGIAALVNVFSARLGRVSDQADKLAEQDKTTPGHDLKLELLRWRSRALDWAVILAALAGASTCGAALALFLGAVRGSAGASLLFLLFDSSAVPRPYRRRARRLRSGDAASRPRNSTPARPQPPQEAQGTANRATLLRVG